MIEKQQKIRYLEIFATQLLMHSSMAAENLQMANKMAAAIAVTASTAIMEFIVADMVASVCKCDRAIRLMDTSLSTSFISFVQDEWKF